jgi:phenylalanyl-tRNA synthetase beta chain
VYGLNNIPLTKNIGSNFLAGKTGARKEKIQHAISDLLTASGFSEIFTNSLTNKAYYEKNAFETASLVEIQNKLSEEHGVMRQTLLFSALEIIQHNVFRRQTELKLYEFGKIYFKGENKYKENNRLAIAITGDFNEESWRNKSRKADYFDLDAQVQNVFTKLGLAKIQSSVLENKLFTYGTEYTLNGKNLVQIGEVSKAVLKQFDLKQTVYYADFDFDYLQKAFSEKLVAQDISKFPEVRRDLSLVIDKNVSYKQIKELALQTEKRLLTEVNVFDVFEGEVLGAGKKSYSVKFILQDNTQTLTDQAIDNVMNKLIQRYEKELGAVIRK